MKNTRRERTKRDEREIMGHSETSAQLRGTDGEGGNIDEALCHRMCTHMCMRVDQCNPVCLAASLDEVIKACFL